MAQGGVSLPTGYTKIEYLEGDGNSYIDTGFKPNQDTRVVATGQMANPLTTLAVYGCTINGSTGFYGCFISTGGALYGRYNGQALQINNIVSAGADFCVDQNKNAIDYNGNTISVDYATFSAENTLAIFASNDGSGISYIGKLKISSVKIYDNGVLVRDFIPCTNPDGISGLWDSVNDVFYKMLPADYTKLDFVESDGTTYIDTGFKPNNNTRVIFEGYNNNANSKWLFGTWNASGSGQFGISMQTGAGVRYGKQAARVTSQTVGDVYAELNKTAYNFNGTTGTLNAETFTCSYNLFIGALNSVGTPTDSSYGFIGRIYSVKIYDNGTLVRDFIPAMNASGAAGLYDLKNDVWYALLPVVTKKENKITLSFLKIYLPSPSGSLLLAYKMSANAAYPVASTIDIRISSDAVTVNEDLSISPGSYYSSETTVPYNNYYIVSISPTEDDTYIYTF